MGPASRLPEAGRRGRDRLRQGERSPSPLRLPASSPVIEVARVIARAGGRAIVVGGWVRDQLLGVTSHDLDLEIFGLDADEITRLLRPLGFSPPVGRHFPVWRHGAHGIDISPPRAGNDLYATDDADSLVRAFGEASRHRDLTINAMGWDPLGESDIRGGEVEPFSDVESAHDEFAEDEEAAEDETQATDGLIDPWGGRDDVLARDLRAVDPATFGADPLRMLRVARISGSIGASVDPALARLCRDQCLDEVPVERVATELRRILTECACPSRAFAFLAEIGRLDVFPPLARLPDVPQDPRFHPEGDVYVHTLMVVDRAAEIGRDLPDEEREILLLAALCHDLGKPETTTVAGDRVRSLGHEARSAERAREWLTSLRIPERRIRAVEALVASHLAPFQFVSQGAGPRAYRRLARKLAKGGVGVSELERLARADHLGRTTPEAERGSFDAGRAFLEAAEGAGVREGSRPDVVLAEHLIERGVMPGPRLGRLLARCRQIEDETGIREVEAIVDRVLAEPDSD